MAMPSKSLIKNSLLTDIIDSYKLGVPLAALHRQYIQQGEDFKISLPVFMKLIKKEI